MDVGYIIMYAMEYNLPCTVLLNHHTCFQPTMWMSGSYCVCMPTLYPWMYNTLTSYYTMMPNDGHYMLNEVGTSTY